MDVDGLEALQAPSVVYLCGDILGICRIYTGICLQLGWLDGMPLLPGCRGGYVRTGRPVVLDFLLPA